MFTIVPRLVQLRAEAQPLLPLVAAQPLSPLVGPQPLLAVQALPQASRAVALLDLLLERRQPPRLRPGPRCATQAHLRLVFLSSCRKCNSSR